MGESAVLDGHNCICWIQYPLRKSDKNGENKNTSIHGYDIHVWKLYNWHCPFGQSIWIASKYFQESFIIFSEFFQETILILSG